MLLTTDRKRDRCVVNVARRMCLPILIALPVGALLIACERSGGSSTNAEAPQSPAATHEDDPVAPRTANNREPATGVCTSPDGRKAAFTWTTYEHTVLLGISGTALRDLSTFPSGV